MSEEDLQNELEPVYVKITVPVDQAWVIVDALRLRGFHELAKTIIHAIDEANQLEP